MPRKKRNSTTDSLPKEDGGIEVISDSDIEVRKAFEECFNFVEPEHPMQKKADDFIFNQGKIRGFMQWGRNGGKSAYKAHALSKHAALKSWRANYIVFPEKTQGMEIMWSNGLLRKMIPDRYVKATEGVSKAAIKNEMRLQLWNNSFVKLLGADDPDALRGIKPDGCGFDEYRDYKEDVYMNMEANLLAKQALLLIGSTPPDVASHYNETRTYFMEQAVKPGSDYFYLESPTECNPHISRRLLAEIKTKLMAQGKFRVWEREYMAKYIPGGASAVFPMWAERKSEIVKPHHLILELIRPDLDTLEFWCVFDPASSSVFGGLLIAYNRVTGQVYVLDEIYERDRMRTSSKDVWLRSREMKMEYVKDLGRWENVYDEHESWFYRDLDRFEIILPSESIQATEKQSRNIEEDLSTIKDLMLAENKYFVSDRCRNLSNEYESFQTNEKGQIVRKKNHLIDCKRYFIAAADFRLNEQPDYEAYLNKVKRLPKEPPSFAKWYAERKRQDNFGDEMDDVESISDVINVEDLYGSEEFFN